MWVSSTKLTCLESGPYLGTTLLCKGMLKEVLETALHVFPNPAKEGNGSIKKKKKKKKRKPCLLSSCPDSSSSSLAKCHQPQSMWCLHFPRILRDFLKTIFPREGRLTLAPCFELGGCQVHVLFFTARNQHPGTRRGQNARARPLGRSAARLGFARSTAWREAFQQWSLSPGTPPSPWCPTRAHCLRSETTNDMGQVKDTPGCGSRIGAQNGLPW